MRWLQQQTVTAMIPTTTDAGDVVMAGNGFVYVFPFEGMFVDVHSVEIGTATDHGKPEGVFDHRTLAKLHPDGKSIYALIYQLPETFVRSDISRGIAVEPYEQEENGDHEKCGDVWISPDGADLFNGCGTVFRAAAGTADDLTYRASLAQTAPSEQDPLYSSMSLDPSHDRIYAITGQQPLTAGATNQQGMLDTFGYQSLALQNSEPIPCVAKGRTTQAARGLYVFTPANGSKIFVLALQPAEGLMALATFDPE